MMIRIGDLGDEFHEAGMSMAIEQYEGLEPRTHDLLGPGYSILTSRHEDVVRGGIATT
jgi:hypothetical protein